MSAETVAVVGGSLFRLGGVAALVSDRTGPDPPRDMSYESGACRQVSANRRWAAAAIGADPNRQVWCRQVHAAVVARVRDADAGPPYAPPVPGADALVCDVPGVLCGVLAADCIPVLLAGRDAFAVAHVGWRGLVSGVVENTVAALVETCGEAAPRMTALVGPHIGPCCFEVGVEVGVEVARISDDAVHAGRDRPHVDLGRAVGVLLTEGGVTRVVSPYGCTRCDSERWYSHRRGDRARHALVACLAAPTGGGSARGPA